MKRMLTALIGAVVLGASVFAQTQAPPPAQAAPPAGQKPAAPTPPPLLPPATKPAPPPFPEGAKVAFVQFQTIVQESKLGKCGQDAMKKFQEDQSVKLLAKQKDAKAVQDQITTQTGVVTDAKISQMNRDLDKLTREFNMMQDQVKADQDALNQQLLDAFRDQVLPIVEAIRVDRKLWMVLTVPDSNIAAADPGLDLSEEAVKKLDEKVPTCGTGKTGK
jgi:Skp family chaperone for outer membrane proteins